MVAWPETKKPRNKWRTWLQLSKFRNAAALGLTLHLNNSICPHLERGVSIYAARGRRPTELCDVLYANSRTNLQAYPLWTRSPLSLSHPPIHPACHHPARPAQPLPQGPASPAFSSLSSGAPALNNGHAIKEGALRTAFHPIHSLSIIRSIARTEYFVHDGPQPIGSSFCLDRLGSVVSD
ncbi:hypothetical protein B0J11DRAFT_514337 [Dendryphion nanum]|uniref:Uncharacterized protein n=1 Tax=Dendryphion nanum TaxID=256645 RepID=A0A9P9EIQ7_9PLEO|nr:hypothetical protein B0J11DRAFT_514337 [Dendryphion nanum]